MRSHFWRVRNDSASKHILRTSQILKMICNEFVVCPFTCVPFWTLIMPNGGNRFHTSFMRNIVDVWALLLPFQICLLPLFHQASLVCMSCTPTLKHESAGLHTRNQGKQLWLKTDYCSLLICEKFKRGNHRHEMPKYEIYIIISVR